VIGILISVRQSFLFSKKKEEKKDFFWNFGEKVMGLI